jgi:hypothetical protein
MKHRLNTDKKGQKTRKPDKTAFLSVFHPCFIRGCFPFFGIAVAESNQTSGYCVYLRVAVSLQ